MKLIVILALLAIVGSLGIAMWHMLRGESNNPDPTRSRRMARALTVRVGLSVLLFVLVLISHQMGWIQPTGLPLR